MPLSFRRLGDLPARTKSGGSGVSLTFETNLHKAGDPGTVAGNDSSPLFGDLI
jgi:hypothetical protein